jgi:hypothetical protein
LELPDKWYGQGILIAWWDRAIWKENILSPSPWTWIARLRI